MSPADAADCYDGFATDEVIDSEGISLGDEIATVGLFSRFHGSSRNEPIVRVGSIAAMPREVVRFDTYGLAPALLVELRSVGGLSGSPVFVHLGVSRFTVGEQRDLVAVPPDTTFRLLGVMPGYWNADPSEAIGTDLTGEPLNIGVGLVSPVESLLRVLSHEGVLMAADSLRRNFGAAIRRRVRSSTVTGESDGHPTIEDDESRLQ